ncbi:MAG: hypothetical protein RIC03_07995 [Cyclobacteriaceae bacterium]
MSTTLDELSALCDRRSTKSIQDFPEIGKSGIVCLVRSSSSFTSIDQQSQIYYISYMTIEQRKLELITWISAIQREDVIERIENLRENPESKIPETILELLHESSSAKLEGCVEHTSARELLGRK